MRRFRQWTALLLAGVVFFLQGCSRGTDVGTGQDRGAESSAILAGDRQPGEKSMGRYLEEEITLPEEVTSMSSYPSACIQKLESGELALMEQAAGLYISSDNGETWTPKAAPWYSEIYDQSYVAQIALAPDGSAAVIYDPYDEEEYTDYVPQYLYADPDGNTRVIEYSDTENYLHQFWFGKDSRLYGCAMNGEVYELETENGGVRKLFESEGLSDFMCFTDRYMVVITSRSEVLLYDLENGMLAEEDKVLQDFVRNSAGNAIGSDSDSYAVVAAEGEQEDVIYLVYSGGLYRHVIGGSAMEQVADGSMNSLGDPMLSLSGFVVLPENEFLVLYNRARLYRYIYDPDMPTVPEEQIGIYSLTEDYTIRQAVSLFQKQHPEVYVRYEVGLSGDGSMTSEDAVKNLNTRIMSGSGPDLLVLDGLPVTSYEEKGVLTDLSKIVYDFKEEDHLFENLVDACRVDGKLWYVPVRFRLPLLVGDRESIEGIKDLVSLADTVEALREAGSSGSLIGLRTEEEVLQTLKLTCSGTWTDPQTGTIDEEKLTEFLWQARRIYQAEIAGIDEKELEDYRENYRESWQSDITGEGMYYAAASANAIDIAMETQRMGAGLTCRMDVDFNTISTLTDQENDFGYVLWQGQVRNGFIPRSMVGICAGSEEKEPVLEFFRFLYGRELQDLEMPSGYPVNKASFEKLKENPKSENEEAAAGIVLADGAGGGAMFALDIRWSSEEHFERLKDMVTSVNTVCTGDSMIEETVCGLGVKAVNGTAGVEETVAEILKKAELYLAE